LKHQIEYMSCSQGLKVPQILKFIEDQMPKVEEDDAS